MVTKGGRKAQTAGKGDKSGQARPRLFVELLIAVKRELRQDTSPLEGIEIVEVMAGGLLIRITNYRIDG